MFKSLKTKMIIMLGIPIFLVNFGFLYFSATSQQKIALEQAEDLSMATTRKHSLELQSLLETALNSANQAAELFRNVNDQNNPLDIGRESTSLILKGMLGKDKKFAGVFSVWEPDAFDMMDVAYGELPGNSKEGRFSPYWSNLVDKEPTLNAMSDSEINLNYGWYKHFRLDPRPCLVWNPSSQLPDDSTKVLRAMAPIINDGQFLGVVGVDITDRTLDTMVSAWDDSTRGITFHLLTTDGNMVASAISDCKNHRGSKHNKNLVTGIQWENDLLIVNHKLLTSLAGSNLIVVSEMPRQVLLGPIQKKLQKRFLIGFIFITAALLIIGYFVKTNLARVERLGIFTRQVALGKNIDYISESSDDEIGNLTRDFHTMLLSLQKSEDERKENLTRLEAILDSVQAGIVIIDPENRTIIDANPAALEMIGRTKEQVLNKVCLGFICPEAQGRCQVLDFEQSLDGERKILLKNDGTELKIFKTVVTIELKGKPYLLETFIDVDQQVKAEMALSDRLTQISQAKKQQDILVSHSVSREEKMVALKTEVNQLRNQLDMPKRYKAPDEIMAWKEDLARNKDREHHEL